MEKLIRRILEKSNDTSISIWLFPYGERGKKIYRMLEMYDYDNTKIKIVDNYCLEENVCKFDEMLKNKSEQDLIMLTSERIEVINMILKEVDSGLLNIHNIVDTYGRYPFSKKTNMRVKQLLYCAEEIYRNHIGGCVAEAGVYKGEFAKYINAFFPNRKCYLFDSFEGFDKNDAKNGKDNKVEYDKWIDKLKDTSVNEVMNKMINPEKVIIKKGFIPETFIDVDEKFAFVSLDMDLYEPTKAALDYFWPRMSKGGYIFCHDFLIWEGIEKAINEFCTEKEIGYIRLMDDASVAILK